MSTQRSNVENQQSTAKAAIYVETASQATQLLKRALGEHCVLSVTVCEDGETEDVLTTEGTKTLNASELQVKSLTDRAKQLTQQTKQTKARQGLVQAQEKLLGAGAGASQIQR